VAISQNCSKYDFDVKEKPENYDQLCDNIVITTISAFQIVLDGTVGIRLIRPLAPPCALNYVHTIT